MKDETVIIRYLKWCKFECLIKTGQLYFSRLDKIQSEFDPHEGTYLSLQIEIRDQWLRENGNDQIIKTERDRLERERKQTYVNCWCVDDCDRQLMWEFYTKGDNRAVAIRSTIGHLRTVIKENSSWGENILCTMVKYIDFRKNMISTSIYEVARTKHAYYKLDQELRLIFNANLTAPTPDSFPIDVDLATLIGSVIMKSGSGGRQNEIHKILKQRPDLEHVAIHLSCNDLT